MADMTLTCAYDHCENTAQLYPGGYRCSEHTPAREHGRPEAPTIDTKWWVRDDGTEMPLSPLSTSWVHDSRAREKGQAVSAARRRAARGQT